MENRIKVEMEKRDEAEGEVDVNVKVKVMERVEGVKGEEDVDHVSEEVVSMWKGRRRPCEKWGGSYGGGNVEVMRGECAM